MFSYSHYPAQPHPIIGKYPAPGLAEHPPPPPGHVGFIPATNGGYSIKENCKNARFKKTNTGTETTIAIPLCQHFSNSMHNSTSKISVHGMHPGLSLLQLSPRVTCLLGWVSVFSI